MRLEDATFKKFGLHQTFAPRFGWLKKAYDGVIADPEIFSKDEAMMVLGVGKNMVDAIAFWASAFRVISPLAKSGRGGVRVFRVTPFGRYLFDSEIGVDPYLENSNSLWLLHWNSLQTGSQLPVWWMSFNLFNSVEFSESQLVLFLVEQTSASNWNFSNEKPIKRDVDCMLKMFAPRERQVRQTVDDFLDSPFRDLGLIKQSTINRGDFRFQLGQKPGLSGAMLTAMCLDFMARHTPDAVTATIGRLANDPCSPGRFLKLTEQAIGNLLADHAVSSSDISLSNPAGSSQLNSLGRPIDVCRKIVNEYYVVERGSKSSDVAGIGSEALQLEAVIEQSKDEKPKRRYQIKSRIAIAKSQSKKSPKVKTK